MWYWPGSRQCGVTDHPWAMGVRGSVPTRRICTSSATNTAFAMEKALQFTGRWRDEIGRHGSYVSRCSQLSGKLGL